MYILSTGVQLRARLSKQDYMQLTNFSNKTIRVRVRLIDWSNSANENTFTKPAGAISHAFTIPPNRSQTYGIIFLGNGTPPLKFEVEITVFDKFSLRRSIVANIYTTTSKGRFLGNNRILDSQLVLKRFRTRIGK